MCMAGEGGGVVGGFFDESGKITFSNIFFGMVAEVSIITQ